MRESKKSKQIQKSGDSSVNIQAENITVGLTYQDVKTLALDVFKSNFYQLSGVAKDTAQKRAEEITNKFLDELKEKNPDGLNVSQDPDFQYSLFNVQKEYARTGDKDLGDILVDILVERTKEKNRGILQIVLDESLQTAPKLTISQFNALSIMFLFKYTVYRGMASVDLFHQYISKFVEPFIESLVKSATCYQHLVYAGCGIISIGSQALEDNILKKYPGIFVKGFTADEVSELLKRDRNIHKILTLSLRNPPLLQISSVDEASAREISQQHDIEPSVMEELIKLQKKHMMDAKEVKEQTIKDVGCMGKLYDVWDNSHMKNMTLTSVGIAIGHANIRRVIKEEFNLSIWINETADQNI